MFASRAAHDIESIEPEPMMSLRNANVQTLNCTSCTRIRDASSVLGSLRLPMKEAWHVDIKTRRCKLVLSKWTYKQEDTEEI